LFGAGNLPEGQNGFNVRAHAQPWLHWDLLAVADDLIAFQGNRRRSDEFSIRPRKGKPSKISSSAQNTIEK
jgi:hypothetical protein